MIAKIISTQPTTKVRLQSKITDLNKEFYIKISKYLLTDALTISEIKWKYITK